MEISGFAVHEEALKLRAQRNEVLSSNIANADTPNYKARDINFADALKGAGEGQLSMKKTRAAHQDAWGTLRGGTRAMYRVPMQPSLDGNTVEADVEQAAFAENAMQYRATLRFLDGKIRTLRLAIKGSE